MNRSITLIAILAVFSGFVTGDVVHGKTSSNNLGSAIAEIDELLKKGVAENYKPSGMDTLKKCLDLCLKTLKDNQNDYEILWRCARASGEYAEAAMIMKMDGWRNYCVKYGKLGISYSDKAKAIEPKRVEAYYWQAQCMGKHIDATSFKDGFKEGYAPKLLLNITKCYTIDRTYHDYSPLFIAAVFFNELPWPLHDKKRALKYYKEFATKTKWEVDSARRRTFAAKLLLSFEDKEYRKEAEKLLEAILKDPHPRQYYCDQARKIQAEIK